MAARAMWRGALCFGGVRVPVKLYAAVADRSVHFRLLHRKDRAPVRQVMVEPEAEQVVPYAESQRAYPTEQGSLVMLDRDELAELEPDSSREIAVEHFLPAHSIDHRWYSRPYYLGPDGDEDAYFALIEALEDSQREGLASWVMRRKTYHGALRLHDGYPMLIALRHADEVVSADTLEAPSGDTLKDKELRMAQQLIDTLEAPFEPSEYQDDYRERVLEMIDAKRRGKHVKVTPLRRPKPSKDLTQALEASLKEVGHG